MAERKPVITLLTDFGLRDHFVATMKGVILRIHPDAQIIDISHDVPPHDILHAAFLLKSSYTYFPLDSIYVVVVDPGVGTDRKPLLVSTETGYFVAPDNGVLSYIYAESSSLTVREITADHYFLKPRSGTFDGRDVFAPVAAWLSKGVSVPAFGEVVNEYTTIEIPQPVSIQPGVLRCRIIHVDRFGNLITNLSLERFQESLDASENRHFAFRVGEHTISHISQSYAEGKKDEIIAVFGSSNCIEVSVNQGNAASLTDLEAGRDIFFKVV